MKLEKLLFEADGKYFLKVFILERKHRLYSIRSIRSAIDRKISRNGKMNFQQILIVYSEELNTGT